MRSAARAQVPAARADELVALAGGPGEPALQALLRRRPNARRLSARIDAPSGRVLVTVPPRASRGQALAFLDGVSDWARARLAALPEALRLAEGVRVPFCGGERMVRRAPGGRGGAWLETDAIVVAGAPEFLARRVTDFLRAEAGRRLAALAAAIAAEHGLACGPIAIRDTRSRWGSCTQAGRLMFNWRLVMAPEAVQHYVVAHELAHLRHMDHGPGFRAALAAMTPHVDAAERWLARHGAALLRVG